MAKWTKKQFKKASVAEVLTAIHNLEIHEVYLHDMKKGNLSEFILEVFNNGCFHDYLNFK
jgi:hypothetical protein